MEWILSVAAVYMIVAIFISWRGEVQLPEDIEHRTLIIFISAILWPIGLLIYFLSPELQEERRQKIEEAKAAEEEHRRREQEHKESKQKAERDANVTKTFVLLFLHKQRQQLEKNLAELEEDDPGRALLQESIDKTDELMAKHQK